MKKTYRVVGTSNVHETEPGGTFTKELDADNESNLIAGGHIEIVKKTRESSSSSSSSSSSKGGKS